VLAECIEVVETWKIVTSRLVWMWPAEGMVITQEVESDGVS